MNSRAQTGAQFGDLTPLLAARSVAVIGASDREGNLGGLAVAYLQKFGFKGPIWPVNAGRPEVAGLKCYPSLRDLPSTPDLAVIAVPADAVVSVVKDCIAASVPAAVVWAGGFAEAGEDGKARQRELENAVRGSTLKLCGPNCIGVINTSIGLTASFSNLMTDLDRFTPGAISIVSQSGGLAVTSHAKAQELGFGFRLSISCGNEATLTIADFIRALAQDDGTRVIAVYLEGLADPKGFVAALAEARARRKPVVILKGGASEISGKAALAHTGKLAGLDKTFDAIFREFAAVRVQSQEDLLDVCLQLASLRPGQVAASDRVLLSSFGGGNGVIAADQCERESLVVQPLTAATREALKPVISPLASALNPVDLTPGSMTTPKHRANLPAVFKTLVDAPEIDSYVLMSTGFAELAPQLVDMIDDLRKKTPKPICVSWGLSPPGTLDNLKSRGIYPFTEHSRALRTAAYLVRYGEALRHRAQRIDTKVPDFPWGKFVDTNAGRVVSENVASAILEAAKLPVARGRIVRSRGEAAAAALEVGLPVAIKGISPAVTHRAKVGLVALNVDSAVAAEKTFDLFQERAKALGVTLEGAFVQHMFEGNVELLVTAFRDANFGVMVGCGIGGGMTEIVADIQFARAPIDADGAYDLIGSLRTMKRMPDFMTEAQRKLAADFVARFSMLVASAPWTEFTFEVNPLKIGNADAMAVDGLLVLGQG